MDMTRPSSGHDQAEDPIKIHHPEEEEHHESRASKMFGKVKARAKKFKNSLTKHGNEHNDDVVDEEEEDDENGEPKTEKHLSPVNEVSETEFKKDLPKRSFEFDQKIKSGIDNDGKPETLTRDEVPAKSQDFDPKIESGPGDDLPTGFAGKPETGRKEEDFPAKSYEFDQKIESGIGNDSPTRFGMKPDTELKEDFPAKSHKFEQTIGSEIGKDTGAEKPGTERREDFLGKNYEFDQEIETATGNDSPTRETELDKKNPAKSDDVKVETGLGRDLPTGTHDQFSPEFSGPKEGNDSQEPKPSTYTEMIGSAALFATDKAIATKNAVVSSLGYSDETASGEHESPVGVETVADDENIKETASPVTSKLPLSGSGKGAEETEQGEDKDLSTIDNLTEKMTPEEEDKAFSDMVAEKLNLGGGEEQKTTTTKEVEEIPLDKLQDGETVAEDGTGGMVGKIKGAYNYWMGGTATEEVKPKSPVSVEESSQSLGFTVGTKGFADAGESGLGETGGSTGAVPVQKGL